jgi:hypothetical protein
LADGPSWALAKLVLERDIGVDLLGRSIRVEDVAYAATLTAAAIGSSAAGSARHPEIGKEASVTQMIWTAAVAIR